MLPSAAVGYVLCFFLLQQWATFSRVWHVIDVKWQNPYDSAKLIKKYLTGLWKPIFHPLSEHSPNLQVW